MFDRKSETRSEIRTVKETQRIITDAYRNLKERAHIVDLSVYNEMMNAGMESKLFFKDYITPKVHTIIDFGCGDGSVIKALYNSKGQERKFREMTFIGIDNNPDMLALASENLYETPFKIEENLFLSLDDMMVSLEMRDLSGCLVLFSSVVHEIAHYGSFGEFMTIMETVSSLEPEQIVIRDMAMPSFSYETMEPVPCSIRNHVLWPSFIENKIATGDFRDCRVSIAKDDKGDIVCVPQVVLYEFLLKYRYCVNWAREKEEEYFPESMHALDMVYSDHILKNGYEVTYANHTVHQYTRDSVRVDFGYKMEVPTHYCRIFTRTKE